MLRQMWKGDKIDHFSLDRFDSRQTLLVWPSENGEKGSADLQTNYLCFFLDHFSSSKDPNPLHSQLLHQTNRYLVFPFSKRFLGSLVSKLGVYVVNA